MTSLDASADDSATQPAAYSHTQQGWIHIPMEIIAILLLVIIWFIPNQRIWEQLALTIGGAFLFLLSRLFRTLTISDEGRDLFVRFGPWAVFRKRIRMERIQAAEAGRTAFIDGLGYHWIPFRGWTLNIAGRDCVKLRMINGSTIRLGTDDVPGLLAALQKRIDPHRRD